MSTEVAFLLLSSDSQWSSTALESLSKLYTKYDRVLVLCDQRQRLIQLDELLWHNSHDQFVAYSLDTECYCDTAPVLLTDIFPKGKRFTTLLNINSDLHSKMAISSGQYRTIIEVIDNDELSKEKARERYKIYRQHGFIISYKNIDTNS